MNSLALDSFLDYAYLSKLSTSPNEKHLTFVKASGRLKQNDYHYTLYLNEGKKQKKLLNLKNDSRYFWETDSTILVPLAKDKEDKKAVKAKKTVLYRFDIESRKLKKAYTFNIPLTHVKVLDADTLLITANLSEGDHDLFDDAKRDAYLESQKEQSFVEEIEEVPFYHNGGTFARKKRKQAFIYSIKDKTWTPLLGKNDTLTKIQHLKEEHKLYLIYAKGGKVLQRSHSVLLHDLKTHKTTSLYDGNDYAIGDVVPINDTLYLFATDKKDYGMNQNFDIFRLEDNRLIPHLPFGKSFTNSIGSDVRLGASLSSHLIGNVYYFVSTYRDRSLIYRFDGTLEVAFNVEGSLDGWVPFRNTFYGIGLYEQKLQELYELVFADNTVKQHSRFNEAVLKDRYHAKGEHITYENDGVTLDGWILYPKDYDPNKTYPAILDIHGGPKTIYANVFYHEMQVWAHQGYFVFFTNPRGGDVDDNAFADIRGRYGTIDYDDLMTFTDIVLDRYPIDAKRVGVTGGSYGGFMTNWIVSHTDRFKCAATQRSISNWISMYGTSDIGFYFSEDQTAAHPLRDTDKMWEQSPLKHAENIKTPLLILHSDEDYRCPIEQAMQLFTTLTVQGIETKFLWFKGENHDLSRSGKPKSRLKRLQAITEWMDTYLK